MKNPLPKPIFYIFLFLFLFIELLSADEKEITIGIIIDGPWQRNQEYVQMINQEIIELTEDDKHIRSIIKDTGIGFKNLKNDIKDILNPYFTTKKDGTGLGLSIVNKIINDHNGTIKFSSINNGAKIEIIEGIQ